MRMHSRTRFLAALATITLLAATPACGPAPAHAASSRPMAKLELRDLSGRHRSVRELRGKVVLVNFWATWCGPCISELPILAEVAERYRSAGLVVVAASIDDAQARDEIEAFARKRGKGLEVWIGADASDMEAMGVPGNTVPATVLLDRSGRIAQRSQGAVSRGELDPLLEKLLAEEGDGQDSPEQPRRSPHKSPGLPEAAAPSRAAQTAGRSL